MQIRELEEWDYPDFLRIYNESFPENERRLYADEEAFKAFVIRKEDKFKGLAVVDGYDRLAGFMTYWIFQDFIYVEHFAVDSKYRGAGTGGAMLEYLINRIGNDILLEVEKPDTPEAIRRIRFYERYGFRVREGIDYVQPPYSAGQEGVEMLLMTHGDVRVRDLSDMEPMLSEVYYGS